MAEPLKVLFLSAEVAPYAKRGGLGDVAGSLPKALAELGHDVRVVMPAYQTIEQGYPGVEPMDLHLDVPLGGGTVPAGAFKGQLPGSEVPIYFVAQWNLFNRPEIYGYYDDPYRFAFFSRAALDLMIAALGWRPDVVHANDWHTAPAVTWLATAGQADPRYRNLPTVFTIHNLAHQGRASWNLLNYLGIVTHSLVEEPYGEINFMARGIYHATMVNTVSPTYAREIMSGAGGAGLDALLRHRSYDVHGILNGIDYEIWNPATDTRIAAHFDAQNMEQRVQNKRALQARAGLPQQDDVPLVAMISRLDWQKGLDFTGHVVDLLLSGYAGPAQFIVLGTGETRYEQMFSRLAHQHPDKMTAFLEYNAGLAHIIYAGSDMFIMPSLFEPCGLGQLLAMRYGSVPVVRATGGLADTVDDAINGFTFYEPTAGDFWNALQRAVYIYHHDRENWRVIQRNGMTRDHSWERSAHGYEQLYEWAIARVRGY
ncbi:MAG: glycogen synthase [Candidatus Promineifilaceae bacterium]|nr:glycogen synthase [Candidatus Promineifilaceae bacterium]